MKSLRIVVIALVAVFVVGALAVLPSVPKALASLSELQMANAQAVRDPAAQPATAGAARATAFTNDLQSTLEQVYQNSKDSVVNIHVTVAAGTALGSLGQGSPNFGGQLPQIPGLPGFGQLLPNQPGNPNQGNGGTPSAQALGSGFVWDQQGDIVTNNHVVDGATSIEVTFADGTSAAASLVGRDPDSDLAVIKVDPQGLNLKPVTVGDSTAVVPGQFTVAIGNPFGLEGTLTFGIVSAVGRSMPANNENVLRTSQASYTIPDIIQTDTPINPGNSGGVLLDMDGKLIGVPTAIESQSGSNAGIGFAVPASIVNNIVPALIKDGKVQHAWLGMSGTTLSSALAQAMNLPATQRGALVIDVTQNGPADKAGIQGSTRQATVNGQDVKVGGDVVTAIDNQPVRRFEDLVAYLAGQKAGNTVTLKVLRNGKETTLNVTLGSRPAAQASTPNAQAQPPQQQPRQQTPRNGGSTAGSAWIGVSGLNVTSEIAQEMNLPQGTQGVLVESISPNSPAEKAGLVASATDFTTSDGEDVKVGGDVITAVDGTRVTTAQQLSRTISQNKPGQEVTLSILRDGAAQDVTVTLAARPAQS